MQRLIAMIVLFAWVTPSGAASNANDLYERGTRAARNGRIDRALELFDRVAAEFPESTLAPHALYQRGQVLETRRGDYDGAEKAYRQLLKAYPHHGIVRRARHRLTRLQKARHSGDEPLRRYNRIRRNYATWDKNRAIAEMWSLYREFPAFAQRDRVLFWIGEELRRQDRFADSIAVYRQLETDHPQSTWAFFAVLNSGHAQIEERDFAAAEQTFIRLRAFETTQEGAAATADSMLALTYRFQTLARLFVFSVVLAVAGFVFGLAAIRWRQVDRRLVLGALFDAVLLAPALLPGLIYLWRKGPIFWHTLVASGVLFAGAALVHRLAVETRPPLAWQRKLWAAGLLAVAGGLLYAVYYQTDLVNLIVDSIQYERQFSEPS